MLLLLSFIVFAATAATAATAASSTSSIREKYLDEIYKQQYRYTLQEIQHDREICPEFHNSAMYFAITGQRQLNRVTQTCRHILHTTVTPAAVRPLPLNLYDRNILSNITLTDLVISFKEFVCYTFEYVMLLISVILASCSTLFMIILLLCQ
jgi:hypothetical protein